MFRLSRGQGYFEDKEQGIEKVHILHIHGFYVPTLHCPHCMHVHISSCG